MRLVVDLTPRRQPAAGRARVYTRRRRQPLRKSARMAVSPAFGAGRADHVPSGHVSAGRASAPSGDRRAAGPADRRPTQGPSWPAREQAYPRTRTEATGAFRRRRKETEGWGSGAAGGASAALKLDGSDPKLKPRKMNRRSYPHRSRCAYAEPPVRCREPPAEPPSPVASEPWARRGCRRLPTACQREPRRAAESRWRRRRWTLAGAATAAIQVSRRCQAVGRLGSLPG